MEKNVLVDAGFLVALLSRRDQHHDWAKVAAADRPPPWRTCESALSEAFHLLGATGQPALAALVQREAVLVDFEMAYHLQEVLALLKKYADVPMSLADACLVRMTETLASAIVVTTDSDFRIYRRHSRQMVPVELPFPARR